MKIPFLFALIILVCVISISSAFTDYGIIETASHGVFQIASAQSSLPDMSITDIKITQIPLTWDYYPQVMKVTISYTWKNQGTGLADDHPDFIKLIGPNGNIIQLIWVGDYGPNKEYVIANQGKVLPDNTDIETVSNGSVYVLVTKDWIPGEYTARVELDATKVIDESNEGNNILEKKFKILDITPQDGSFVLPCSMQEKGDGVSTSSCYGFYQNSIARAEVGINYQSGLFPITNYMAVGFFIDKNGHQGQNITVTLDKINPGESKTLVFTNIAPGFVSQFKMQMLGGILVTETPDTLPPIIIVPQNIVVNLNNTSVIPTPVKFSVTATDNVGVTSGPTCTPVSGSTFPIGVTTVSCTAMDKIGNVGKASFTITISKQDVTPSVDKIEVQMMEKSSSNTSCAKNDQCYSPSNVHLNVGGTVTWYNDDIAYHTVTSNDGSSEEFDSGMVKPGKTFSYKFNNSGTYDYYCMIHPWMVGTVVVGDGISNPTQPTISANIDLNNQVYTGNNVVSFSGKVFGIKDGEILNVIVFDPKGNQVIGKWKFGVGWHGAISSVSPQTYIIDGKYQLQIKYQDLLLTEKSFEYNTQQGMKEPVDDKNTALKKAADAKKALDAKKAEDKGVMTDQEIAAKKAIADKEAADAKKALDAKKAAEKKALDAKKAEKIKIAKEKAKERAKEKAKANTEMKSK